MKAAIYVRVSSQEQYEHGYSIRAQEDKLIAFAKSQDWEVMKVYKEEGRSAKDMDRPQLQDMMRNASMYDVVLVHKLDRLTRSVLDANKILNELEKQNTAFKSATEPYDTTTAQGKMFLNIMASLAQFEREQLVERVRFGMEQSAREGNWSGGHSPLGYDYINGEFVINEEEAKLVKNIFDLSRSNGFASVAKLLNNKGYKTKTGGNFHHTTIRYTLMNPVYIGKNRFNEGRADKYKPLDQQKLYDGKHDPIIDKQTFWDMQNILKDRSNMGKRMNSTKYYFTGPLRCNRCGGKMSGNLHNGKKVYRCNNRTMKKNCDMPSMMEVSIEKTFLQEYEQHISDYLGDLQMDETDTDTKGVQKEIKQIQKRMSKYKTMYVNDLIGIDELNQNIYALREQEKELQQKLQPKTQTLDDEVLKLIQNFSSLWHEANDQEKKELVNVIFNSIYIDASGSWGPGKPRGTVITKVKLL